jgi:hypothetical protein
MTLKYVAATVVAILWIVAATVWMTAQVVAVKPVPPKS